MDVEETTPTAAQISWTARPPQLTAKTPDPKSTGPAKPRIVGGFNVVRLAFKDTDGHIVPCLLCTPRNGKGPFPLVIAVHGLGSDKAQVCAQVAPTLTKKGFAILAPDMPCHGERPGDPRDLVSHADLDLLFTRYHEAVVDVHECIDLAEARKDLDTSHGVVLLGYSMGSWISSLAGPSDPRVKAMVLMVGGAADIPPVALLLPKVAVTDPRNGLSHFAGRPLLMLNGKNDSTVLPDLAKRLFAAAAEPKEQRWYNCGHLLTAQAYQDAANWISKTTHDLDAAAAKPDHPAGHGS